MTEDGRAVASFENLEVFQRAYRVSLEVHRASLEFPKIEQHALADQLRRASKSICANIAEGFARQKRSKAEFRRYLQMALGSSDEMRVWLRYCLDLGYIGAPCWQQWRDEYQGVSKMLQGLHRKADG
jgi:four helix bundle protein